MCVNAAAVNGFNSNSGTYTLGGFDFSTFATLSINTANSNPRASATTSVTCEDRDINQSSGIYVSITTDIVVAYTDGSFTYGFYPINQPTSYHYTIYGENNTNYAFADVYSTRTVEYIAAEHHASNDSNSFDNGTVGTSIGFSSKHFEFCSFVNIILPGIDF